MPHCGSALQRAQQAVVFVVFIITCRMSLNCAQHARGSAWLLAAGSQRRLYMRLRALEQAVQVMEMQVDMISREDAPRAAVKGGRAAAGWGGVGGCLVVDVVLDDAADVGVQGVGGCAIGRRREAARQDNQPQHGRLEPHRTTQDGCGWGG